MMYWMKDSLMLIESQYFWDKFSEKSKWITAYKYKQIKSYNLDQIQINNHGLVSQKIFQKEMLSQTDIKNIHKEAFITIVMFQEILQLEMINPTC